MGLDSLDLFIQLLCVRTDQHDPAQTPQPLEMNFHPDHGMGCLSVVNFSGTMCVRFAIAMAEADFFPSVLYHYTFWYKPVEMPQHIAFFYSVGQVSSALSGLLAYAISHMDQLGGLSGWKWLFLLEGLPAVILAFFAFGLPDYPETENFLSVEERLHLKYRLASNALEGEKN